MYDLLIEGSYNLKKRLRSGDVIFVTARKGIITISGGVKRPARYEINDKQFLDDVINYANGMKQNADIENIFLERMLDGKLKSIPVVNTSQFKTIRPVDGDLIYVREFPYRDVKITGAVKRPGSFTMSSGESIQDLVNKAGGYLDNAYPYGAIYTTLQAKTINQKSNDILYQQFLDNIIAISQQNTTQNFDLDSIIKLAQEVKNIEPNGRVIVDMLDDKNLSLYSLSNKDEIFIPEINNNVFIYGETSVEGAVMFKEGMDVKYYVNKSGGFKKFADIESIYILHPNGESASYSQKRNIFESRPKKDIQIYPGSIIFIPRKIDQSVTRRLAAQAYVSILGNIGIALASLSAIDKN